MSSLPPDPYKTLGVSKDAQLPEIRSAHRKLVLKCHPDKVQDATLKAQKQDEFQKVQQAYELLSDEKERQRYDDQVRVAELRKQMQAKANSSSPRTTTTYKYEVHTAERPSSYKSSSGQTPTGAKVYTSYSRSYEDDSRGTRFFEPEIRTVRRESSYSDKPSKRETERERDREREREKDRERERRKQEEASIRRAEKEFKENRRAEKKAREKERDKDRKRESEEKKRHAKPYIETFEDDIPIPVIKTEKKKSSSKKHDDKRERSSPHRDEMSPSAISIDRTLDYAANYIEASRSKPPGLHRAATYHERQFQQPPAVPTPPPAPGQSRFPVPDEDDARRSSAKPRRGSSGEKSYRKPSREVLDDPEIIDVSPRHVPSFQKSSTNIPAMSGSPPRRDLPRTNTMPAEPSYTRPIPSMTRAQTYSGSYDTADHPRGRTRSKLQPQIEESESEGEYEPRHRDRKHRSSKKHRSPEHSGGEFVKQYRVDGSRTRLQSTYSRQAEHADSYGYYPGVRYMESGRPSMPFRESSYSSSSGAAKFPKVKTSKSYGYDDVAYSSHYPTYREDYAAYA